MILILNRMTLKREIQKKQIHLQCKHNNWCIISITLILTCFLCVNMKVVTSVDMLSSINESMMHYVSILLLKQVHGQSRIKMNKLYKRVTKECL